MTAFARLDRRLAFTEDSATIILLGLAIVALIVALAGSPTVKAAVAAWMILP